MDLNKPDTIRKQIEDEERKANKALFGLELTNEELQESGFIEEKMKEKEKPAETWQEAKKRYLEQNMKVVSIEERKQKILAENRRQDLEEERKINKLKEICSRAADMDDQEYAIKRKALEKELANESIDASLDGMRRTERAARKNAQPNAEADNRPDWIKGLQISREGWITGNVATVKAFLRNNESLIGLFNLNELSSEIWMMRSPPWTSEDTHTKQVYPRRLEDRDYANLAAWLASPRECGHHVREPSISTIVRPTVAAVSADLTWNPIKAWLNSIQWDGTKRVDSFLSDILDVPNTEYLIAVSRVLLLAPCQRIRWPGCKMDYMPILYSGKQGYFKSTFVFTLYDHKWTRTLSPRAITSGDAGRELQGIWAIELPELEAMRKADVEAVKALLSQQSDSWVPKYVESAIVRPRIPIIIGTTNNPTPLRDASGNRRFLMVECPNRIDIEYVKETREQLFAEAWMLSESVNLELKGVALNTANTLQEGAYHSDDWEDLIKDWIKDRRLHDAGFNKITQKEIWKDCLGGDHSRYNFSTDGLRIGNIMRKLGYKKTGGGQGGHYWKLT